MALLQSKDCNNLKNMMKIMIEQFLSIEIVSMGSPNQDKQQQQKGEHEINEIDEDNEDNSDNDDDDDGDEHEVIFLLDNDKKTEIEERVSYSFSVLIHMYYYDIYRG